MCSVTVLRVLLICKRCFVMFFLSLEKLEGSNNPKKSNRGLALNCYPDWYHHHPFKIITWADCMTDIYSQYLKTQSFLEPREWGKETVLRATQTSPVFGKSSYLEVSRLYLEALSLTLWYDGFLFQVNWPIPAAPNVTIWLLAPHAPRKRLFYWWITLDEVIFTEMRGITTCSGGQKVS